MTRSFKWSFREYLNLRKKEGKETDLRSHAISCLARHAAHPGRVSGAKKSQMYGDWNDGGRLLEAFDAYDALF